MPLGPDQKKTKHISCNTGTRALPVCPHSPSGAARPRTSCVHIRQHTRACVTTITYTQQSSSIECMYSTTIEHEVQLTNIENSAKTLQLTKFSHVT